MVDFRSVLLLLGVLLIRGSDSVQLLMGSSISFSCSYSDLPVVWDFESAGIRSHSTLAFLDTNNRFYVDSSTKHKLEREGLGTRFTIYDITLQDGGVYTCRKFYDQTAQQKFQVEVVVPPQDFRIDQPDPAEEGDLYTMACIADRVKPVPRITWQMRLSNGDLINMTSSSVVSAFSYSDSTNRVTSNVGVELTRTVQGSTFICHIELSTTQLGTIYSNRAQAHTTNALFKPLAPLLYGLDDTLVGNQISTLRCTAGYANPAAEITWYKGSHTWSASKVDVDSFIGYFVTTSYLEINATHQVDNSTFFCSVTNTLMIRDNDPPLVANKTAHVIYAPIIAAWINNKTVTEGQAFELDCAVKFSRPIATIRWVRNDAAVDLGSSRFAVYPYPHTKWTSIIIRNSTSEDVGSWRCEAFNTVGIASSKPIFVDVRHRPYCVENITYVYSDLEQTAAITCVVRSNPSAGVSVSWEFNDKQIAANQKAEIRTTSQYLAYHTIYVETRTESDFGSFYCTARNQYGTTPERCEVQVAYKKEEVTGETPAFLAAFGGGAQSYIVITCIGLGALILLVLVIAIVVVKRNRSTAEEPLTDVAAAEAAPEGDMNVYVTSASGDAAAVTDSADRAVGGAVTDSAGAAIGSAVTASGEVGDSGFTNGSYSPASSIPVPKAAEGSPEYLLHQELQDVISKSQKPS